MQEIVSTKTKCNLHRRDSKLDCQDGTYKFNCKRPFQNLQIWSNDSNVTNSASK